jgi:hypothetical protein
MFQLKRLGMFVWALAMAGCASVSVEPGKLRPVTEAKTIELVRPVQWKYDSGLGMGYWQYLLVAGSYMATLEDDSGTYFLGPKPTCLYQTVIIPSEPPSGSSLQCLIFVPRKAGEMPTVFFVNGSALKQHAFTADKAPVVDQVDPGVSLARSSPDTSGAVSSALATSIPANATPMQAGLAGGIAAGLIAVMSKSEVGNLVRFNKQPPAGWLQAATQ